MYCVSLCITALDVYKAVKTLAFLLIIATLTVPSSCMPLGRLTIIRVKSTFWRQDEDGSG